MNANIKQNVIIERTAYFLSFFEPYSALNEDQRIELATHIEITHAEPGQEFFRELQTPQPYIYIVHRGAIRLEREGKLLDIAEPGDLFGHEDYPTAYTYSALASEESLIYRIPAARALEFFPDLASFHKKSFISAGAQPEDSADPFAVLHAEKPVATVDPLTPIRDAAIIMRDKRIGSLLVASAGVPEGIITDTDFTRKIGTGLISIDNPVSTLMSSPVFTMSSPVSVSDAMVAMMRHGIRHIVLTHNGEPTGKISGIITEHDILLTQGNNPLVLLRETLSRNDSQGLKEVRDKTETMIHSSIERGVNMRFLATAVNELNDALIDTSIRLASQKMEENGRGVAPLRYVWLSLGSEGRAEQFLRTDQDNALLYENDDNLDQAARDSARSWFIDFAKLVNDNLHAAGFEYCPAEMMAGNPKWNMTLSGWEKTFSRWVQTPDPDSVMHSTIFFDFRPVHGDFQLAARLKVILKKLIRKNKAYLTYLAANALANPAPLSFFKNFLLERSGEHKNEFDIKSRALMPLIDAARVFALEKELLHCSSTMNRYKALLEEKDTDSSLARTLRDAMDSFDFVLSLRVKSGLRHNDSGRYIRIDELSRLEKQSLKTAFEAIATLQKAVSLRYRLNVLPG